MFNHNRGLWGYTGTAPDGAPVTIQATGMGGPSAAIVLEELVALGVRRAIRVGTAGSLSAELALGELLVVEDAIVADGTSRALGAGARATSDRGLLRALSEADPSARVGSVVSSDLFYEVGAPRFELWRSAGALAVEMEAATLFALGALRGIHTGCVLAISDLLGASRERIEPAALAEAGLAAGRLGLAALMRASAP